MNPVKLAAALCASTLLFGSTAAFAQLSPVPDVGFRLGDNVAVVKAATGTPLDPEPMARAPGLPANVPDLNAGKSELHLRTKGIWAFFGSTGTVYTIRLDAPFAGAVRGVKIGDSVKTLTDKLGNPIKKPYAAFFSMKAYQYALDDSAYVTFEVSDDGVQYILITK